MKETNQEQMKTKAIDSDQYRKGYSVIYKDLGLHWVTARAIIYKWRKQEEPS